MLRFDEIVFGPVHSRRLGSSLGINLLPKDGKLCNFDCIYCECGWNSEGYLSRPVLPSADEVAAALEIKLGECRDNGVCIDSITFSGHGEPTIHPDFAAVIDNTLALRDKYYPDARVSVLSNATMIGSDKIFEALKRVDNPIMKIDAVSGEGVRVINRPCGAYDLDKIVSRLKEFKGNFILQTMFLRGGGYDISESDNIARWKSLVRELQPRGIMVYTIDRETPQKGLGKFTVEEMTALVQPLVEEGFDVQITG